MGKTCATRSTVRVQLEIILTARNGPKMFKLTAKNAISTHVIADVKRERINKMSISPQRVLRHAVAQHVDAAILRSCALTNTC